MHWLRKQENAQRAALFFNYTTSTLARTTCPALREEASTLCSLHNSCANLTNFYMLALVEATALKQLAT